MGAHVSTPTAVSGGSPLIKTGEYKALAKRRINGETCKFFGYKTARYKDKPVQVAPFYRDGSVVAQKLRDSSKQFKVVGDGKSLPFFGQNRWTRDAGKRLIVTEGEIDCMSISQLQGNKWPVVSVPNGAQGAHKTVSAEIEFLEKFETVVFAFDMDKPGQDAARKCAALLSPGKAYIASLPHKDANESLVAGAGKALINSLWEAEQFRPDGIIDISTLVDQASEDIVVGLPWPWETLNDCTYGIRRGELYGFGGGTGCGKSTIFKQIMMHHIEENNLRVGGIFLEEPAKLTAKTLAGMFMRKRVHVPEVEYDKTDLQDTLRSLGSRVFLYDHFGSMDFTVIRDKIRYMVRALGIKDIFLDHLTALASSVGDKERQAIDRIMAEMSSLTQELDCTIYYVSHLTTPDGKPHEEGGRVMEKHFRGSRSIAYWSHFMFGIERDKQDLDGVTTFRVLKDRYTGDANGVTFGLRYDKNTGLLEECEIPRAGQRDGSEFDEGDF